MDNCKKNFGFTHKCGILMPISSLPSRYGIGSFGKSAFDFIDFLDRSGQTCWQVLPLNPTSYGDSPYQSPASVAGNPYFIDLDILKDKQLLTADELSSNRFTGDRVDYGWLFDNRYPLLRLAHSRFCEDSDYVSFCNDNASWIDDYALFMALKVHYGYTPWVTWEKCHKDHDRAVLHTDEFKTECDFWKWVQYEFTRQWDSLHAYAMSKGISIIGDLPIYVAHDSVDVWRATDQFLLDDDYSPIIVAGCPPDAYAEDGQLWGNPIYNWERMKNDGFIWWIERIKKCFALYDLLRIDHFRGFASYYSIIAGEGTARNGRWREAPGKELFDAVKAEFPQAKIIAEDLGFITDDVRELLKYTDFPGMKVLQFAFYNDDSEYLPRMFECDNCIVYSSTHDSDCTKSWYSSLDGESLKRFKRECKREKGQSATYATINLAMKSRANLAIIPMQDYLELTNDNGRMNVPSKASGNWTWRVSPRYNNTRLCKKILDVAEASGRKKV